MNAIPRKAWIASMLSALGSDKETVAHSLTVQGYIGSRGDGKICPIAQYLRSFYPNADLRVGNTGIHGCIDGLLLLETVRLYPIFEFIRDFDNSGHPLLDRSGEMLPFKAMGRRSTGEVETILGSKDKQKAEQARKKAKGYASTWMEETLA
jgi:hypothetical protein